MKENLRNQNQTETNINWKQIQRKLRERVKESDIFQCQSCGLEIERGNLFCEKHNRTMYKQAYEFFTELPSRPRGDKLYTLIFLYLAAKFDIIDQKRMILKSISGAGKSHLLDMIAFLELTLFPNSLTVIGSISDSVSKEHILRLRGWLSNSMFSRYMTGTRDATASKSEIKLAKLNSRIVSMPQSKETRSGWHPCVPGDSEVLTRFGWRQISEIEKGQEILAFDGKAEDLRWEPILATLSYKYTGDLLEWHHKKRNFRMHVTPYHRVIWKHDTTQNWRVDLAVNLENRSSIVIPARGNQVINNNDYDDKIVVNGKTYDAIPFFKLIGYYLSEGWVHKKTICICQHTKSKYYQEIKNTLHTIWGDKVPYSVSKWTWSKYDPHLAEWLCENCGTGSFNKKIPSFIYSSHPILISALVESYLQGDGHYRKDRTWRSHTVSRELADGINALEILIGWSSSIRRNIRKQYIVSQLGSGACHFTSKSNRIHWDDNVYSIQVPSTFFVMRQEGIVFITGNSLLLLDEVGRMRKDDYYLSFFQMGRTTGVVEISASTPFLDSIVMQEIWNSKNVIRIPLELEDCWWIPRSCIEDLENSNLPPEMKEQIFRAKFRLVSNRVVPDDFLSYAIEKGKHPPLTRSFSMGVDFGKAQDPSAIVVINIDTGDVVFAKSLELKEDWNLQFEKIREVYRRFKPERIFADSSSIGEPIITTSLLDLPIEAISMQGGTNKRAVINRLKMAFNNRKINIVLDDFPELINELSMYVYYDPEHTQTGPFGHTHDDLVDALALAIGGIDIMAGVGYTDVGAWGISGPRDYIDFKDDSDKTSDVFTIDVI